MKRIRILCVFLSMILCLSVTGTAGSIADWTDRWDDAVSDSAVISLSPGSTETEMRFGWLSEPFTDNQFEIGQTADLSDAKTLPVRQRLTASGKVCRVTAEQLTPDTVYYYRYTKNGTWSDIYSFRTEGETMTALFVSDAQLGRSGDRKSKNVLLHDTAGWDTTLTNALTQYPDTSLIVSAGDQAEVGFSEQEYRLFLAPDVLRSVPIAPGVGNHEFYYPLLNRHFSLPNRFGGSILHFLGDEPYWFARGNVLFIQLDSNDPFTWDHEAVLDSAIHAYPDAKWRVVTMHHSLYSCEDSDTDGPALRNMLVPLLQKYNINLVLSGHTHRYSRSYPLWNGKENENGIIYLEGGCASGCNSKASPAELPTYSAAGYAQADEPVYCVLAFSDDAVQIASCAVRDGESIPIDSGTVTAYPRDDTAAHRTPFVRILHVILSLCGRLVSVWY